MTIDGINILSTYGCFLGQGAYGPLASAPALKPFETNDWPDEDGIEPDLSAPVLDSRELSLPFFGGNMDSLISLLSNGAYHTFIFPEIGLTKVLRMTGGESYDQIGGLRHFSLRFADDFPLDGYEYSAPNKSGITGYQIAGIDLGSYGIAVLDARQMHKAAPVKKNLVVSLSSKPGLDYDGQAVYRSSMEVGIKCLMRCSVVDFWHNYNALLYDLTTPGIKIFKGEDKAFNCYYGGIDVDELVPTQGGVWCQFSLNLIFTMSELYIMKFLTSEAGQVLLTEDGLIVKLN